MTPSAQAVAWCTESLVEPEAGGKWLEAILHLHLRPRSQLSVRRLGQNLPSRCWSYFRCQFCEKTS